MYLKFAGHYKKDLPGTPICTSQNEVAEYKLCIQVNEHIGEGQAMLAIARLICLDETMEICTKQVQYNDQLCQDTVFLYEKQCRIKISPSCKGR